MSRPGPVRRPRHRLTSKRRPRHPRRVPRRRVNRARRDAGAARPTPARLSPATARRTCCDRTRARTRRRSAGTDPDRCAWRRFCRPRSSDSCTDAPVIMCTLPPSRRVKTGANSRVKWRVALSSLVCFLFFFLFGYFSVKRRSFKLRLASFQSLRALPYLHDLLLRKMREHISLLDPLAAIYLICLCSILHLA